MYLNLLKMFDSISKVWNEVAEEGNESSVEFQPTSRKSSHYMHYDKPGRTLLRKQSGAARRFGSPRILKPSTEQKKNTFWGALGKMFTGGEDEELGNMKNYMSGMIKKRPRQISVTSYDNKISRTLDSGPRTVSDELERKTLDINERAERFTAETLYPDLKKIRRLEPTDFHTSSAGYTDHFNTVLNRKPQYSSTPKEPKRSYTNKIVKMNELPSSPFIPVADNSKEKIDELSAKIKYLESTVETLRDELRLTNERSMQLEQSFRQEETKQIRHDIKHETRKENEFEDLSPVKINLDKFKLIK